MSNSKISRLYTAYGIKVRYRPEFLELEKAEILRRHLTETVPWIHPKINKDGSASRRRNKIIYGDSRLDGYTASYQGKTITTKILPWSDCPILETIKESIDSVVEQKHDVCVLQLYNNGKVGINPHQDKEMTSGTIISTLSLGASRTTRIQSLRSGEILDIVLESGSLFTMEPPTNDMSLHSILEDDTIENRLSAVFRNCESMYPQVVLDISD